MSRRFIVLGLVVGMGVLASPVWGQSRPAGKPVGSDGGKKKVSPEVYSALKKSTDGTVLVEVTLRSVGADPRFGDTWDLIAQRQDDVLARLETDDFKVTYRPYNVTPTVLAGHASATGLAQLASDPDVVAVKSGKIISHVYAKLEKSDDGTAFVCVILKTAVKKDSSSSKRRAAIKKVQDKVLGRMKPDELKLAWRFKTAAMMAGHANAAGLAKLANVADVVMVRPSKVAPKVYSQLARTADGTVDILANLTRVPDRRLLAREETKSKIKAIQDRVLSVFEPGEFKLMGRFGSSLSHIDGHVSAAGLAKLEAHADVIAVGGGGAFKINLLESVPFINADLVHVNLGYTGAGIAA